MTSPRATLPPGRHFAVTWAIPDTYGGMTEALLHRSRAFDRLGGAAVDVLTFDDATDYPAREAALRARGALSERMRLVNLYDWLRTHPVAEGGLRLDRHRFSPLADGPGIEAHSRDGRVLARVRRGADGGVLQVDHLRADGTLAVSDLRDARVAGSRGGRSVVLCDDAGLPVRSFGRIWGLYEAWLDALTAGEQSYMIVDSKTTARFMLQYRRPHVVTAHVVHASHRARTPTGIRTSRQEVFENPGRFDLLLVLSSRQARDIRRSVGPVPNLGVVRNGRDLGAPPPLSPPRDRSRGVVIAGLTPRKRVSHAIRAVQQVNAGADGDVTLDVYGDGESRRALERRGEGDPAIRFHGHDTQARDRLRDASFLLLTSRSEGFPLVLIEALAAGCIPIAYDVDYGPADAIRHGRTGLLVQAGDVDALALAIRGLLALPERRVAAMRRRAVRASRGFTDERVTRQWAGLLTRAATRRRLRRWHRMRRVRAALSRSPVLRDAVVAPTVAVAAGVRRLARSQ